MQRTLLTLALIAAAGAAAAQTATTPAPRGGSTATPSTSAPSTSAPSTSAPSANMPSAPSQTMDAGGASMQGVNPPSAVDTNTANASGQPTGQARIAQKRIEGDGYKNVQGLAQGSDGLWHGRAMRGSAEVQVTVDKRGNVSQQ
jgi:hypothetical protein